MKPRKEFQELLRQKHLRKTSQRDLIWGLLVDSKGHPSVEEIRDLLLSRGHRIGMATIYRTLKILLSAGMIRQSKLGGMTRYEAVVQQPNHLHFVCNACGRTTEFPSPRIETLIQNITAEHGFEERYSRYMIFGTCKVCRRKQERADAVSERVRVQKTAVRDALELTLAIERLGYTFYTNASKKTRDGGGRTMFRRLAAEESEHLRRLQKEHAALLEANSWLRREPARLPVSRKIAKDIFPQRQLLKYQVSDETTDAEALKLAVDLERRSHQFFETFARQLTDPAGRKAFLEFARAEESHLETLLAEQKSLSQRERAVRAPQTREPGEGSFVS
jgi:Fur family ferric uptake transcriptional regulator